MYCIASLARHALFSQISNPIPCTGAVAHVKNEETQEWWRFDDEATSLMKHGPVGEAGDHGVQASVTAAGKVRRTSSPSSSGVMAGHWGKMLRAADASPVRTVPDDHAALEIAGSN